MPAKLPHDNLSYHPIHLTYRLAGSIPRQAEVELCRWRTRQLQHLEAQVLELPDWMQPEAKSQGKLRIQFRYEQRQEKLLHQPAKGPLYLQHPDVAAIVIESWKFLHARRDVLVYAVCVMGNHVHVVLSGSAGSPDVSLGPIMENHKGYTARMANRKLARTGKTFWESGYFDRRIRQGRFMRVMWYVVRNPVSAGLVRQWEDWPATWVHPEYAPMFTGRLPVGEAG